MEFNAGRYSDSARDGEVAFESGKKSLGPEAPITVIAMQSLAVDYMQMGQNDRAEKLLRKALDLQVKAAGYDSAPTLDTSDSLAYLYMKEGRNEEARTLLERGLQSYRKVFGPDHPNTQRELFGLTTLQFNMGRYQEAEQLCASVTESNRRLLGPDHFKTLSTARMLARIYEAEGKLKQAATLMEDTLRRTVSTLGRASTETVYGNEVLAHIYQAQNEYGKAETLLREAESEADRAYGGTNPDGFVAKQLLGANLLHQGRCDEALKYLQQGKQRWDESSSHSWKRFEAQSLLGQALACQKRFGEAEPLLLSGYDGLRKNADKMPVIQQVQVKEAGDRVAQLHAAWKKPSPQ